jgi:hypothetical protein
MHIAIIVALISFIGIVVFIGSIHGGVIEDEAEQKQITEVLIYIVPIATLFSIIGGFAFFRKRLQFIHQMEELSTKLNNYKGNSIIRYAILEGAAFFGLVAFLLSGVVWFLPYPFLIILIMLLIRPTHARIVKDLMLKE